jgi:hydroxyethylthiazole kinase-like uncharacterized protein yjeF
MKGVLGLSPSELKNFCDTGLITPSRMRAVDRNAADLGVQPMQLMESAGRSLAEAVLEFQPERVLILCGKGNNGGDGMAAARHLQQCSRTDLLYPAEGMSTPDAMSQLRSLRHCAVFLHPFRCTEDVMRHARLFAEADVIVDAMLGIGVAGLPREPLLSCVNLANASMARVVTADLPTPGINADIVCAFHRPKVEGSRVIDIGIPLAAECHIGPGDLRELVRKDDAAHKGAGGRVLVIGGGPYQGAPYLAALAALRSGADLVRVASPVYLPHPDLIVEPLAGTRIGGEHLDRLCDLAGQADVVLIGNGLGAESHAVVEELVPVCRRAVLDADALRTPLPAAAETIYTPHAGEFLRMFGVSLPGDVAARGRLIRDHAGDAMLLVKGRVDIISDGDRVRFNTAGCSSMTVGGTGDVLAGVASALFCRNPAFEAACAAAYVNGKAGMRVDGQKGDGMLASDLLDSIPGELIREDK